jgi:hypothetical protein
VLLKFVFIQDVKVEYYQLEINKFPTFQVEYYNLLIIFPREYLHYYDGVGNESP